MRNHRFIDTIHLTPKTSEIGPDAVPLDEQPLVPSHSQLPHACVVEAVSRIDASGVLEQLERWRTDDLATRRRASRTTIVSERTVLRACCS
jgi:hypothetical protein